MNRPLHILYVLASPSWGGGEQYVADLVAALPAGGYRCCAVTPPGGPNRERLARTIDPQRIWELPMRSLFDFGSARALARIVRQERIDLVHVNKFSDAFLALWARRLSRRPIRIVLTRHLIRRGKSNPLYNYLYGQLDKLVFVSDTARREFLSGGAKVDPHKIEVVHNAIPDRLCRRRVADGTIRLVYAGRIVPEKGIDLLLDAFCRLQNENVRLDLYGTGPQDYVEQLRRRAEETGVGSGVRFAGYTEDVHAALERADIGVLPTVAREAFGLAILEYMRAGLAVVTTDGGAQREFLVDGRDALLVPPGDVDALAEALRRLTEEDALRNRLAIEGRRAFETRLGYDIFLRKMTDLYEGLCE